MKRKLCFAAIIIFALSIAKPLNAQWMQVKGLENQYINCLYVDGNKFYAGLDSSIIFISRDGGKEWSKIIIPKIFDHYSTHKEVKFDTHAIINHSNKLYLGTNCGVVYSTDDGKTWREKTETVGDEINAFAKSGNYLFTGSVYQGVYVYDGKDTTWKKAKELPGIKYQALLFQNKDLLAGGDDVSGEDYGNMFRSTNFGNSWHRLGDNFDESIYCIAVLGNKLFTGTVHGVYLYAPKSYLLDNWDLYSLGLPEEGSYKCGVTSLVVYNGNLYAGTFKGVFVLDNKKAEWSSFGLENKFVRSLIIVKSELYAAAENGLWKINLSSPQSKVPSTRVK